MGAFIFKQPNGLYGRWSSVVDAFTALNMTKEGYQVLSIEDCIRNAKHTLENDLQPYENAVFNAHNMIRHYKWRIDDAENDEERKEYEEEYESQKKEYEFDLERTTDTNVPDPVEDEYYKTTIELIDLLCCRFTDDWENRDYTILNHPEHMAKILPKLKEIIKEIKSYE